jgi:ferredoxin
MAYRIVAENCTACGACEEECPNQAISQVGDVFVIDPDKCTECQGFHDSPQCAAVCPVDDTCIPA